MAAKLRMYKDKLEGYKKFYSIVKTIKMVNLAKFRQTIDRVKTRDGHLRYSEKCFGTVATPEEAITSQGSILFVPITSNRGSCGAMNSNTFNYIESILGPKCKLLGVGKKAYDTLPKRFANEYQYAIINDFKNPLNFAYATFLVENVQTFKTQDSTHYFFNRFVSAGTQRLSAYNVPSFEKWFEKLNQIASTEQDKANYCFANAVLNNDEQFVRDFYDFHHANVVLNAVCENELSEYAARMMAVEGQLTNIQALQHKTQYLYNKTRQSSITASLIEILSAISAMEGNASKGVHKEAFWLESSH